MCSYQSPTSLFPPLELLSLAAIYRDVTGRNPFFIDAVAQKKNINEVIQFISKQQVQCVVSLIGFECFEEDMQTIARLKEQCNNIKIFVFGHYPTQFSEEILKKSAADVVLKGEPEEVFSENILSFSEKTSGKQIWSLPTGSGVNKNRIKNYNNLPTAAYELADHTHYHEPMMAHPFGMIQSARGCPYSCNYCVRSFGARLTLRSPEKVVEEILLLKKIHNIRALRFIDDTFTINKKRVLDICQLIIAGRIKLEWSCLSRTDNVDEEMLYWMKRAGCKRIYYGVENASQRILDFYKKGINVKEAFNAIQLTNTAGIETAGFFMLGLPEETEEDFNLNKEFITDAKFDFIGIGGLVVYPGTPLFDIYKTEVDFNLFPYVNRFKDKQLQKRYLKWNKELYSSFMCSKHFAKGVIVKAVQSPKQSFITLKNAIGYQLEYGHGVFHHIQRHNKALNYFE